MAASVFDQILDFAHRPNPYPLYARLRETPVSRQEDGTYVVSTYREIVALLHDPRVSSDQRNRSCPVEGGESSPLDAGGSGPRAPRSPARADPAPRVALRVGRDPPRRCLPGSSPSTRRSTIASAG